MLRRLPHPSRRPAFPRCRRATGAVLPAHGQRGGRRCHGGLRHQPALPDRQRAPGVQRLLHHQLRRAAVARAGSGVWHRVRVDHHHPLGDERPAGDRCLSPRRPAPHALGLPVGDPGVHRAGARYRAPAAGTCRAHPGQSGACADRQRLVPGHHPADRS
ncbi:hypothetical protein D3C76_1064790 [compost metagenome]